MVNSEFVARAALAASKQTAYMWGTWGSPISEDLIQRKAKQYPSRYSESRKKALRKLIGQAFAFDCVGLVKGILWGWTGDLAKINGGAVYEANGVPDTNVTGFRGLCTGLSTDFTHLAPGELVFMDGHIGIYAGAGKCIEATLGGKYDGVVVTDLIGRGWTEHGKCKFITYEETPVAEKKIWLHVQKVGLNVREQISFNWRNRANAKILAFCPIGGNMEVLEFIPGLQRDGYQWMRVRYNGKEGFSQLDTAAYYLFRE